MTICSPNFLHDAHIRLALRSGAHAICEKPLVLNPWNCDALQELEQESGKHIYTILQLRVHPSVVELKNRIDNETNGKRHQVDLQYMTSRGKWYLFSWKGDEDKSGGLATNIGIHFFDMLMWIFGGVDKNEVTVKEPTRCAGKLELEKATVNWRLSINRDDLPEEAVKEGKPTFRSIKVDGDEFEFSGGFTDLHTEVYKQTLAGNGFRIADAKAAIEVAHDIRGT
jgi:UDP-N-acetyl-2-amino-2-deoxyglucuronate dehydrogenase